MDKSTVNLPSSGSDFDVISGVWKEVLLRKMEELIALAEELSDDSQDPDEPEGSNEDGENSGEDVTFEEIKEMLRMLDFSELHNVSETLESSRILKKPMHREISIIDDKKEDTKPTSQDTPLAISRWGETTVLCNKFHPDTHPCLCIDDFNRRSQFETPVK